MKYALIIPDGVADEPLDSLGGKTPLQAAQTPNMDAIVQAGRIGRTNNVPESLPSGSDVGTMSLFGYDPLKYLKGRAPLEAAAQGIELGPHDWALRCNLVTIENGRMVSFTAGQIPNALAGELMQRLQDDQCGGPQWEFHAGVSYRNLLIYRARENEAPFDSETRTIPPHDITGQPVADYRPQGPGADILRRMMDRSVELFAACRSNQERRARGEQPATQIWLWGQGQRPALEPFAERYGCTGAVITAVDLLRGIARLLGWKVVEVPGATGYLDTDYAAKGRAAIETIQDVDLVVVHVEATDEASHEGDAEAKIQAVERIDSEIVGPLHEHLKSQGDYRILVSPDHPTFLRTKTHSHGYVPFAWCGAGIAPGAERSYDEIAARQSDLEFARGYELMATFLGTGIDGR